MWVKKIEIKTENNQTKLVYFDGILDDGLKREIKAHKDLILQRMEENALAHNAGFLIYDHGGIYEYRFGLGSYLYIERLPNGRTNVWRESYQPNQKASYKVKMMAQNVPFMKSLSEAQGFMNWLNNKRGRSRGA